MAKLPRTELGGTGLPISRFIFGACGPGRDRRRVGAGHRGLRSGCATAPRPRPRHRNQRHPHRYIYARGASEQILGRRLAANPDADVLVQTKTGFTPDGPDLSPQRLRTQLDKSRQILGRVDLFLPHTVDPDTPWADSLPVLSGSRRSWRYPCVRALQRHRKRPCQRPGDR